jgi:hypothetical protein
MWMEKWLHALHAVTAITAPQTVFDGDKGFTHTA